MQTHWQQLLLEYLTPCMLVYIDLDNVLDDPSNRSKHLTLENTLAQVVFQLDTDPTQTCQLHSHFGLRN